MHFKMKIIAVLDDVFLKQHWSPYRKCTVIEPICILWKEPQNNPMNPPEAKVNSVQPCVTIPRWSPSGTACASASSRCSATPRPAVLRNATSVRGRRKTGLLPRHQATQAGAKANIHISEMHTYCKQSCFQMQMETDKYKSKYKYKTWSRGHQDTGAKTNTRLLPASGCELFFCNLRRKICE